MLRMELTATTKLHENKCIQPDTSSPDGFDIFAIALSDVYIQANQIVLLLPLKNIGFTVVLFLKLKENINKFQKNTARV